LDRICAYDAGDGDEFHHIESVFAALIFCNKRLRFFQANGQGLLGKAGGLSRADHQGAKGGLIGRMNGFSDTASARCHQQGTLIPPSDYPEKG
jgi:hypothetical protein